MRMDDWIIDHVAQPVADRLAWWRTPDSIGRFLCVGTVVFTIMEVYYRYAHDGLTGLMAFAQAVFLSCVLHVIYATPSPSEGMVPVARVMHRMLRPLLTTLFLAFFALNILLLIFGGIAFDVIDYLLTAENFTYSAGLYFMACRTNPPRRQTKTVWADAAGGA